MTVDLNSDLGEGHGSWTMGDDDALLSIVTSANVACGFHAGDAEIMYSRPATCSRSDRHFAQCPASTWPPCRSRRTTG